MPRSPRAHSTPASQGGLSYVEVLLTVLLLSMVVAGIIPLLAQGENAYQELRRRQEMIQNARVAMDKLQRELRVAESFRVVSPTLIRSTLFWGDGSGGTPTAEYALNAVSGDLEYRWSADWDYRRQITVTAVDALPAGYAVALTFNHAALVAAGRSLANGDDVRVRYWTGTEMVELDRVLDPTSSWNSVTTRIWFRLPAAMAAATVNNNPYLYYGNLNALAPPANGDNVFFDYESGTTLGGWTRRDVLAGTYAPSPADGFLFTASAGSGSGNRHLSKNVPHGNAEVFWNFQSNLAGASNVHHIGVSARRSDTGAGYMVTPVERVAGSWRLRIRRSATWAAAGTVIGNRTVGYTPGTSYYGKFSLVGSALQVKFWPAGIPEPAWICSGAGANAVCVTDGTYAVGNHYALQDGLAVAQDHRHRTLIVRPRVTNEPLLILGVETTGTRPDALESLAGPFRSMAVTCYDASGAVVACVPVTPVRSVQVSLVVMDPSGRIPDITVTGRTFRQTP